MASICKLIFLHESYNIDLTYLYLYVNTIYISIYLYHVSVYQDKYTYIYIYTDNEWPPFVDRHFYMNPII